MVWGCCPVLFSLKKRLLHAILTCAGSFISFACDYLLLGILCMIHIFCFLQGWFGFLFLIVRGTSFTELSVVFN